MDKRVLLIVPVALLGFALWKTPSEAPKISGFFENQPTLVSSRVQGRVKRLAVREGDTVQAGQLLIELESQTSQAELESLQRQAEQARQQYLEVQAGTRPEEIRRQQAVVEELEANYQKLANGARSEEIAQARAAERAAQAGYARAQRGLTAEERAQLKARVDSAAAEERVTAAEVERFRPLWEKEEISRQDFDRKTATAERARQSRKDAEEAYLRAQRGTPREELEQSRQQWLQARAAWELLAHGTRPEEVRAAAARVEQARAQLDQLRNGDTREQRAQKRAAMQAAQASLRSQRDRVDERLVKAVEGGQVERIPVAVGDLVNPGATLLRLANPRDVWIRVYVPEAKLAHIQVGGPVQIQVDGLGAQLKGHIESINTRGEFKPANLQSSEERARQVFGVKVRLDQPDERVKPGLYADVKL
ncbi:MAG: HlyD family efflux transporter periplasmic adaptor subunit [Candidatus Eremiobacteraeota bacterium]|nr:HlyD family efflux transporter periplasmic adaptor subunit [Candidatus Eremiobacteraeota bacterium]